MTPLFKDTVAFLLTLILLLLLPKAHAGTDKEFVDLMGDKDVVYEGTCNFRKDGTFTFKNSEMKYQFPCVVGMDLPDETKHFIVILDKHGKPLKVILYDEDTKKDYLLWFRGVEV